MSKFNASSLEIEDYVKEIASKARIQAFYPQTISRKLNIPIDIVLIKLSELKEDGRIELKYEIKCLEDLNTIETVDYYDRLIGEKVFCEICGEEIEINYNNIYPIFYINNEYREYIKKKILD